MVCVEGGLVEAQVSWSKWLVLDLSTGILDGGDHGCTPRLKAGIPAVTDAGGDCDVHIDVADTFVERVGEGFLVVGLDGDVGDWRGEGC